MHKYLLEVKTTLIDYYYSLHTLRFLYISFIRQILFASCTLPSSAFLPLTNQSEAAKVFKCMTDMGSWIRGFQFSTKIPGMSCCYFVANVTLHSLLLYRIHFFLFYVWGATVEIMARTAKREENCYRKPNEKWVSVVINTAWVCPVNRCWSFCF